jgi:hypothetical protein
MKRIEKIRKLEKKFKKTNDKKKKEEEKNKELQLEKKRICSKKWSEGNNITTIQYKEDTIELQIWRKQNFENFEKKIEKINYLKKINNFVK